ncbi:DUF397 domain-containing protein [Streptomyces sp. NPDC085596]|uniref:DUF397 domain-containing protein n=1 Tax=Streptomyces sp. NPDC085596 TaxID=3365731 RepID=UPI0037D03A15
MRQYDLTNAHWYKSSYSNGEGGNCVEVAASVPGVVPVRDSKVSDGAVVIVGVSAWAHFIDSAGAENSRCTSSI